MKNLRIAVVPTETGNDIDQNSSVEEILACEETVLYTIPDYCQAQNNEEMDLLHWTFLIDIETKEELTGSNTDGVDYFSKESNIAYIKKVIAEWGETTCGELELDSSPCLHSFGSGKDNVSQLVEHFEKDRVIAITYQDESELGDEYIIYENLPDDIIEEIRLIMENYETDCLKTEKRCQD